MNFAKRIAIGLEKTTKLPFTNINSDLSDICTHATSQVGHSIHMRCLGRAWLLITFDCGRAHNARCDLAQLKPCAIAP
jgi:hypothetical protein